MKKNRRAIFKLFICVLFTVFCSKETRSQYKLKDSCAAFSLHLISNLQSDTVRFSFVGCDNRNTGSHQIVLTNGEATINGEINRATEAILFADQKSAWMDGPAAIRFIIEPANMTLHFSMLNDTAKNIEISGSPAQKEKEKWEAANAWLMSARDQNENVLIQLLRRKDMLDSSDFEKKLDIIGKKRDSLKELSILASLKYIKANPDSYFSGYLLNHFKRSISPDTLEAYYNLLHSSVTSSNFGKSILSDLLKLSGDWNFKRKYTDSTTFQILRNAKSIYDISILNRKGIKTSFSTFKGDLILIDFWASWCGPCIENVPYLKQTMAEIKNKYFKVVSVSLDENKDIWAKSIMKYGFPGVHLFDSSSLLSTFLKVLWVPRYVLVNPDGSIADMEAPYPEDPKLKIEINDLLTKMEH